MIETITGIVTLLSALPGDVITLILIGLIFLKYINYRYEVEHYYTGRFLKFAEGKLDKIIIKSVTNFDDNYSKWGQGKSCATTCVFAKNSFESAMDISMSRLKEELKQMRRQNGYHNKSDAELDKYIDDRADHLLTLSRHTLRNKAYGLKQFLDETADDRYTVDDAKKVVKEILKFDIEDHKRKKKDLVNVYKILFNKIGNMNDFEQ